MGSLRRPIIALAVAPTLAVAAIGCGGSGSSATTTAGGLTDTAPAAVRSTASTATARARTGDDGLTHGQARRAERGAKRHAKGVVIEIDRDNEDDGRISYDVDVLSRSGARTQVSLDQRFRLTRKMAKSRPDDLTYGQAVRARKSALRHAKGVVTEIDGEDEGRVRYEVDILRAKSGPVTLRLSRGYKLLSRR